MTLKEFLTDWHSSSPRMLVHTSGSTGAPKPMWVEKQRMCNSARITCDFLRLHPGDSALLCMSLDYIAGKMMVVRAIERQLDLISVAPSGHPLRSLTRPITFAAMVPMQVFNSLQVPEERERLRQIKHLIIGGGAIDDLLAVQLRSFPNAVWSTYGMTETTATISCWGDDKFDLQSVGEVMPNVQIRIGEENEILVKGGMVMKGYYKNPEETAKVFTEDGYLRTGDAGNLDGNNNVFITERIKELMKTSNGKYIAPQHIEGKVGKYTLIEQIAVIADGKRFVSALIVPNFEALSQVMKELNIKYKNTADLLKQSQVIEYISKQLQKFQSDLPDYEQIKKFTLLPTAFTIERDEITPTLKLKRKVIYANYSREIEAMYR